MVLTIQWFDTFSTTGERERIASEEIVRDVSTPVDMTRLDASLSFERWTLSIER